jgi:hypothetical protein
MLRYVTTLVLAGLLGAGPEQAPVPGRTFPLADVRGAADRTGIEGRLDHMRYDPATHRLFIACVGNGSLEVIDLDSGARAGSVRGLRGPQGVAVSGGSVYVTTGDDGVLHQFDTRTLAPGKSVPVGDDADNVRVARDGKIWVSFGGEKRGGFACLDGDPWLSTGSSTCPGCPRAFNSTRPARGSSPTCRPASGQRRTAP